MGKRIEGLQSKLSTRLDLLPPLAMIAVGEVLAEGAAKYPNINDGSNDRPNWHYISQADHINHALTHLMMQLNGDITEDHLTHAVVRLMFALDLRERSVDYDG